MQNPTPTVGRLVFGGVLLAVMFALTIGALMFPVTTSQSQPPPVGFEWIGVPPEVDVECGTLLQRHDPVWPETFRDRIDSGDDSAVIGCDDAAATRRTMTLAFGAVLVFGVVLLVVAIRARRRDLHTSD